jgi:hypothetical protein
MAIFAEIAETHANFGETFTAVRESFSEIGARHVHFILGFADVGESLCDFGEALTDAGQKCTDRGSPFT